MNTDWRQQLRTARSRAGLSQRELAERSGVSPETVRGYEAGRRRPNRERLTALLGSLECTAYETNEVLEAAGLVTPSTLFTNTEYPNYFFSIDELQHEVELVAWPEFVLNNANELVAANAAVQALWGIDFAQERESRTRAQLNLLSVASQRKFADHIVNWNECVATLAAVFKGRPVNPASLDEPDPYFSEVLQEFANGDPTFLAHLVQIWTTTPGRDAKVRWSYRVVWRDDEFGEMRFNSIVGTANEPGGLSFNDWIPLDAEAWRVLQCLKDRAGK